MTKAHRLGDPGLVFKVPEQYLDCVQHGFNVETKSGKGVLSMWGVSEHPYFSETRRRLLNFDYISETAIGWNTDRVLKPFWLNELEFKVGDVFPCGSVLKAKLIVQQAKKLKLM